MMNWLPYVSTIVAILAVFISLWVAVRAGSWRNSEELKIIQKKQVSTDTHLSDELRKIEGRQSASEARIAVVESQVESEFSNVKQMLARVEQSLLRMESFFMRPPTN
jgi:hypothetical protein